MAKKKKNQVETGRILGRLNDDGTITPFIQKQQQEDIAPVKDTWLKKGALDDSGYAVQNPIDAINRVNASILMTGIDALGQFGKGFLGSAEGVSDIAKTTTADVLDFFGADNKANKLRKNAEKQWKVNQELEESLVDDNGFGIDDMSFLGTKGKSVPQGLGTTAFSMTAGSVLGGAGGMALLGMSAAGNAEQDAIKEMKANQDINGFSDKEIYKQAKLYGLISGTIEAGTEMMFGGISQGSKLLGIGTGVFDSADDAAINLLTKKISNKLVKNFTQAGLKATSEGIEEVLSGLGNAWAKKLTYMKSEDINKLIEDENLLDSFLSGTFSAALSQAPGYVQSVTTNEGGKIRLQNQNEIRDYITNLNAQEQQVVEREIENRLNQEENPTNKRRIEIEKQVIEDLDRGYISANTIRDTLGENYNAERDLRLNESFNEETRRGEAYQNDVSKYDEKQRATIQKAIDSGLLNNSNKTHDFVDLIAKISADKGVDFDFTNNERITESGFGIKGKTVNGFVKDGTINLNLESNQALNKTVGHEITHVLEGTDVYKELQNSLKSYLGEKEWNNRINELEKTYKNVENANIENELTSDLVGDYIFNDESFIRNLSTKNMNLFQKIFDEIKYMVRVATAGSKEARELEKAKRIFEKAYREASKTQKGTQYQLEENEKYQSILTNKKEMNLGSYQEGLSKTDKSYRYNKVNSYDIKNGGRGDNVQVAVTKKGYIANNALLSDNVKGKGEGTKIMLDLNQQSLEETGYPLRSLPEYNIVGIKNHTEEGKGLWDSLVRKGFAVKNSDNTYTMLETAPTVEEYVKQRESNTKYSLTEDNQGRELSKEQQEYFKDSKIRNNKGELEVVYHTSPNQFTIFDNTKIGENTGYSNTAFGYFVTPNKNFSQRFGDVNEEGTKGNTMELYANVTNPITHPYYAGYKYEGQELDNIVRNYMEAIGNEDVISDFESMVEEGEADTLYDAYMSYALTEDPFEFAEDERMALEEKGYDGVEFIEGLDKDVNYGVSDSTEPVSSYAVFNSNQLKNLDNTKPTTNQDIRYSLSVEEANTGVDSEGRKLSDNQLAYFRESKITDENGNLIPLYHGSNSEFTVFDITKSGESSKEAKVGFWFTPNKTGAENFANEVWYGDKKPTTYEVYLDIKNPKIYETYEVDQQQRDNMLQNMRNLEQEIRDSSHKYAWTETGDYKVTSLYNDLVEMNRREINGIKFKEDNMYNEEFYKRLAAERNISNEQFNEMLQDAKNQVELEAQNRKARDDYYTYVYSDAYEQFKTELYLSAGMSAEDANVGGMGMMIKNENEAVANFVEGLKQEGYDGIIIKNTHYDRESLGQGKNNDQYVAFYSNQIKNIDNLNPTEDADIRYSLGQQQNTEGWNVRSEDVRLQSAFKEAIAPIQEQVQELTNTINDLKENIAPMRALTEEEANEYSKQIDESFKDEPAPIRQNLTEEENRRMDMLELLERNNMLTEEQRYEMEDLEAKQYPDYKLEEEVSPSEALSDIRDIEEVGSPKVKSYQYEHPEVKPYFQQEARAMLSDLNNSQKGERFTVTSNTNDGHVLEQETWKGIPRFTSPQIAELLDSRWNYSYDDIRKGLNAIIEDHGAENIAVAKRIEFILDENLRNGYTDWQTGMEIPPNSDYLNMLAEQAWDNYFDDIDTQYPFEQAAAQYALESEVENDNETDFSDVSIQNMTADDINLEPFMSMIEGQDERQRARNELRKEANTKKEVFIPKDTGWRRLTNKLKTMFVNEFAVTDQFAKDSGNMDIKYKGDTFNNYVPLALSNIEDGQTDINGKVIGRSGNSIFDEAQSLGLEDVFDTYLKHMANVDRAKQGKGGNYTAKESYKIAKQLEERHPQLKKLGNDLWQFYRNARHNLRDAGVISQEFSDRLGRMYPHYNPFVSENIEQYFSDTGELKPRRTIKRAKGGSTLEGLLSSREAMEKYMFSQFAETTGNDFFREIVKSSNNQFVMEGDTRLNPVNTDHLYADKDGYYLTAYENGEPITAKISKDMYDTLSRKMKNTINEYEETFSKVLKPLEIFNKVRRNVLTSMSPTFIPKNAIKDIQEGVFNSKYTKDFIKNVPKAYQELLQNTEEAQRFRSLYGSGNSMGQFENKGKNINFLKGVQRANELIEIAPRMAEYLASRENGCSIQEAMYNAREVTTNFSRGGVITKAFNKYGATFLNSSVQGFDKFIRNFSGENGAKGIVNSLAKAAIFGVAPAVFNELAFGSGDDKDEEYEALPDYIKDNYYIIKTGDGNFIRIPKGRVFSVFGSAARRTIEYASGEENAFEGYLDNVQQQIGINNPEENNIFAPLLQALGGRELDSGQTAGSEWYGGDIIPSRLQKERPEDQYDASIDKLSIWLGQRTGISPYKINYVLDQYSGGMGDIFLPMITEEANSDGSLIAPIKDQFTADTITDNKYVSEFYDTKGKLYTGSKATDEDILKNKYMSSISSEMAKLYAERREVQADTSLTKQQKYAKSQAIKSEINRLAKEGMDNYNDVIMSSNYAKIGDTEYYKNANGTWTVTTDDVASLGLDAEEKSEYYKVKNDIYTTKKNNDGNDKALVVQDIVNSNLTPDAKVSLYTSNYKDDLIQPLVDTGMDVDSYLTFKSQEFTADKDSNGKSISGSKKRKVFDYINSMNIPYEQKLILAKSQYNSFNDNNYEIIEYINNSNTDYETKVSIYQSLGFKVEDGYVRW